MTQDNLLTRLRKRLLAFALSIGIGLSGAGALSGCTPNTPDSPNPGGGYEQPLPGEGTEDNKFSGYSQTLKNIFTDDYYQSLAWDIQSGASSEKIAKFDTIPYGFLQDKGYNIKDIKSNNKVISVVYIKKDEPNQLYVDCKVEHKSSENYYACYLLKYELSDQEKKELNMLFKPAKKDNRGEEVIYVQASFYVQELSYLKTPTLLNTSYISCDSFDKIQKDLKNNYKSNKTFTILDFKSNDSNIMHYVTIALLSNPSNNNYGDLFDYQEIECLRIGKSPIVNIDNNSIYKADTIGSLDKIINEKTNYISFYSGSKSYENMLKNSKYEDIFNLN